MATQETTTSNRVHPTFRTVPTIWMGIVYRGSRTKATFWRWRPSDTQKKLEVPVRPALLLALSCVAVSATESATAGEATRTLRAELKAAPGQPFSVENLAGAMRVVAGDGDVVEAVATIHAESEALAGALRLEQVTDEKGRPTLRVRYPLDRYRSYRYPAAPDSHGGRWGRWFDGGHSSTRYDGYANVRVSRNDGVLAYADVEVRVPRRAIDAVFRNVVGPLSGSGVDGRLRFDTGSR